VLLRFRGFAVDNAEVGFFCMPRFWRLVRVLPLYGFGTTGSELVNDGLKTDSRESNTRPLSSNGGKVLYEKRRIRPLRVSDSEPSQQPRYRRIRVAASPMWRSCG
jgi:hypothetical protein